MTDLEDVGANEPSHPHPGVPRTRLHMWHAPVPEDDDDDDGRTLAALRRENQDLRDALASQPVIDQAKGALMLRYCVDADSAFGLLVRWSQNTNIKVRDIADTLVRSMSGGQAGVHSSALASELDHVLGRGSCDPEERPG